MTISFAAFVSALAAAVTLSLAVLATWDAVRRGLEYQVRLAQIRLEESEAHDIRLLDRRIGEIEGRQEVLDRELASTRSAVTMSTGRRGR